MGFRWREKWCLFWHRNLLIVSRYPGSVHVACGRCGCEFGINHNVRVCLPWRDIEDDMRHIEPLPRPQADF